MSLNFNSKNIKNISWIVHHWYSIVDLRHNKIRSVKHLYKMMDWGYYIENNRIKEMKEQSYDFDDNKIKDISFIIDTVDEMNLEYDGFYFMDYHKVHNKYLHHLERKID